MRRPYGWKPMRTVCVLAALTLAIGCGKKEKSNTEKSETDFMTIDELQQKVLAKDWEALNIVDTMAQPESAVPLLSKLVDHEDVEVRELALNCAAMIADPAIPRLLVGALRDDDKDIRIYALGSLGSYDFDSVADDLVANVDNDDAEVRGGVALLLGRTGRQEVVAKLQARREIEQDLDTQRDIELALAKLGNGELKDLFASQMDISDSQKRLKGFADLRYIGDRSLAVRILPALDDLGRAHLVSSKSEPEAKFARVCDAAVNLISELCGEPFSFVVDDYKVYSDDEITEAKRYLETLKTE